MNRIEAKQLSIEFINRAYELAELVEANLNDCPEESRYLSHGYYLKLENNKSQKHICLVLFKKNDDGSINPVKNYSWIFTIPRSIGGYCANLEVIQYALNLYINWIIDDETETLYVHFLHIP